MRRTLLAAALLALALVPAHAAAPASASEIRPLLIGSAVPEATVQTLDGESVQLSGDDPAVLIFYRGGW